MSGIVAGDPPRSVVQTAQLIMSGRRVAEARDDDVRRAAVAFFVGDVVDTKSDEWVQGAFDTMAFLARKSTQALELARESRLAAERRQPPTSRRTN